MTILHPALLPTSLVELVDDKNELAALDDQLDVVAEDEAPKRVVAKLRCHALVIKWIY